MPPAGQYLHTIKAKLKAQREKKDLTVEPKRGGPLQFISIKSVVISSCKINIIIIIISGWTDEAARAQHFP